MSSTKSIFDNAKRKIQIEQTVRGFLQLLDENVEHVRIYYLSRYIS